MPYPASSYPEGVDLTIIAGNQLHQVINGEANEVVSTTSGDIPSVRKALADSMMFKVPIDWVQGEVTTDPLETRLYNGQPYWAPEATLANPITLGASPVATTDWLLAPQGYRNDYNLGKYQVGILISDSLEYVVYNGESYFATNPPYTTTATTPDNDGNLFVGGYVSEASLPSKISDFTDVNFPKENNSNEIIVVCSGQSNALGRFGGGDNSQNSDVKLWNVNGSTWVTANPAVVNYQTNMGGGDSWGNGDNNIAFQFCKRLQEATGKTVYLILEAKGGAGIDNWVNGDYNQTLINAVNLALGTTGSPDRKKVDYFLWVQGENDLLNNRSFDYYQTRFEAMITELAAESWYSLDDTLIVAPSVGKQYLANNNVRNPDVNMYLSGLGVSQPDKLGQSVTVSTLNTTYGDYAHYSGQSLVDIGNRAFDAACRFTDDSNRAGFAVSYYQIINEYETQNYFGGEYAAGVDYQAGFDPLSWGTQNIVLGFAACIDVVAAGQGNSIFGTNALRGFDDIGDNNVVLSSNMNSEIPVTKTQKLGDQNTIIGTRCAIKNINQASTRNVISGSAVAFNATDIGSRNCLQGSNVAASATSIGDYNIAFGDVCLSASAIGDYNIAIGYKAAGGTHTDIGSGNIAIGELSLGGNTNSGTLGSGAVRHVAIGYAAANNLNTDSGGNGGIVALGRNAGSLYQDGLAATAMTNVTLLGPNTRVSGNNQVQLGDSATTTYAYGAVQDRSDERDKTDIKALTDAHIAFFMDVEWKQYRLDYRDDYAELQDDGTVVNYPKDGSRARARYHVGAIAQQVEAAMQEHGVDFAGLQHHSINGGCDVYTLGYQEFIGIQGEIIQRQQKRIERIEDRLDSAGM